MMKKVSLYGVVVMTGIVMSGCESLSSMKTTSYGSGIVIDIDSLHGIYVDTNADRRADVLINGTAEQLPKVEKRDHVFFPYDSVTKKIDVVIPVRN